MNRSNLEGAMHSQQGSSGDMEKRPSFLLHDDENASHDSREDDDSEEVSARQESQHIACCRLAFLLLLVGTCALVSSFTFLFLKGEEYKDYRSSYDQLVNSMQEVVEAKMDTFHDGMTTLADQYTAQSNDATQFPNISLAMFEILGENVRKITGARTVSYAPFVQDNQAWVEFAQRNLEWVDNSRRVTAGGVTVSSSGEQNIGPVEAEDKVWMFDTSNILSTGQPARSESTGKSVPMWQLSPPPAIPKDVLNYDLLSSTELAPMLLNLPSVKAPLFSSGSGPDSFACMGTGEFNNTQANMPHSLYMVPVFDELGSNETVVGVAVGCLSWDSFLSNLLPESVSGIYVVLESSCGDTFSYILDGENARLLGPGDRHDATFDDTVVGVHVVGQSKPVYRHEEREPVQPTEGFCEYSLYFYSSSQFKETRDSGIALGFAISLTVVFGVMALSFLLYDCFVRRRNDKVVQKAARSDAILSSLFPSNVRDRLFQEQKEKESGEGDRQSRKPQSRLHKYLASGDFGVVEEDAQGEQVAQEKPVIAFKGKPIADLFPETTIMFGDIAGFTAWSSVREPSQVFTLLETLYHSFDEIARKRKVFKVETVGDCYVAVTGLPDPQKDHAVIMCRFARDCLLKVRQLTKKLEVLLGPDTGDLAMRIGLHSGPVTAGVLRGERSRFQLFGDTMNTASRMESTGLRDRIQVSQETADLLVAAGKNEWVKPREDKVHAKGKGELQTFWLMTADRSDLASVYHSDDGAQFLSDEDLAAVETARDIFDAKTSRLIDWNVDVLIRLLKHIVARRHATPVRNPQTPDEAQFMRRGTPVLEEVKEIIELPKFDAAAAIDQEDPEGIILSNLVIAQLHDYVCNIAAIYRDNSFHSFEHASHVTMSVTKLLSRIVAPSEFDFNRQDMDISGKREIAITLHDHTYGITSDPLTQFACVFSALIHDVDHTGVPNAQLVKENARIAAYYKGKSVAEQNSVDLAWDLLMDPNYQDLRDAIYATDCELKRFRQLVVNSVMATDIVDKELKVLRNMRWDRAFSENARAEVDEIEDRNRRATIVIEHLIQASDVAHTMQHWHIYRKWNERLFVECYEAYKNGRAEKDPAEGWYQGEIGFFDFYIIPLAKKLKDCGVFGVSSDEYLNYAIKNRAEWEIRGREIVDEMLEQLTRSKEFATSTEPMALAHNPEQNVSISRPA